MTCLGEPIDDVLIDQIMVLMLFANSERVGRLPHGGLGDTVCATLKGSFFDDPSVPNSPLSVPNSPASEASRDFFAPQAKLLPILRQKWPNSRQNGAPRSSTGKTKVGLLAELSM